MFAIFCYFQSLITYLNIVTTENYSRSASDIKTYFIYNFILALIKMHFTKTKKLIGENTYFLEF